MNIFEKQIITPPKTPNEGQVIVMAGAAGSGKNYTIQKYTDINQKFKVLDIDEIKFLILKSDKIFNRFKKFLKDVEAPYADFTDSDLKSKSILKDTIFVDYLYEFMNLTGIPRNRLGVFLRAGQNKDRLPNVLLNTTFSNTSALDEKLLVLLESGYRPENVHLIWVFASREKSMARNLTRDRTVSDEYLERSFMDSLKNIKSFVTGGVGDLNKKIKGKMWAVINDPILKDVGDSEFSYILLRDNRGNWNNEGIKKIFDIVSRNN